MPIDSTRRTKREMAATLAVLGASAILAPGLIPGLSSLGPAALAQVAGQAAGLTGAASSERAGEGAGAIVQSARDLSVQGRYVEARAMLDGLAGSSVMNTLPATQRGEALTLLKQVDGQLRSADPLEVSLQKAELGSRQGDLLQAERQAGLVTGSSQSTAEQRARAESVLQGIKSQREQLAPLADQMIAKSKSDFESGQFAQAKAGVLSLGRSGVALSKDQMAAVEERRLAIVQIEQQRGASFDTQPVAMMSVMTTATRGGAMEPGEVRRPGAPSAPEAPAAPETPDLPPMPPLPPMPAALEAGAPEQAPSAVPASSEPRAYPNAVVPVPSAVPSTNSSSGATSGTSSQKAGVAGPWPKTEEDGWAFPTRRGSGSSPAESAPEAPTWQPTSEPMQPAMQTMTQSVTISQPTQGDDLITLAMRAEALRFLAEADQAFDQARYSLAAEKYQTALTQYRSYMSQSDIDRAEKRLAESNVRLGSNVSGDRLGQGIVDGLTLRQQQARAQFENELQQARAKLAEGDAGRATDLAARARLTMTGAKNAFSEPEFDGYLKQLDQFNREIESRRDQLAKDDASKREADLKVKAKQAEGTRITDRDRKVAESIDRVRALQAERKYKEALQVVDQALFLDPNNPTALLLRDIIRDITIYQRFNNTQAEKQYWHAQQNLDNEAAMIPPGGFVDYPTDWPAKTFLRGELGTFADAPENRRVLAALGDKKIDLSLTDNRFEDVVGFLGKVTGLPIDADWESLASVGIEKDTLLTLKAPSIRAETALNRIIAKLSRDATSKPGWAVSEGIITIASDESLRKNRVLHIYNILDLLLEIPKHTEVPQIDLSSVLQQGSGGQGTNPFTGNNNAQAPTREQLEQRKLQRVRQIVDILQQNIDFDGWKDNGGDTGFLQELNGSLIITNTPKNHREIVGLLAKLREIRNMQINVETKFLLVNQSWFEQIGFDLDIVFNTRSNTVTTAQATNPNTLPSDFFNFSPSGGGRLGLQRTATGVPGAPPSVTGALPDRTSPIGAQQNSFGLAQSLSEGDFASQVLRNAPALGIAGQFLDDIQVDFLIQATQADRRTVQLTAPRLTFTNGQTSNIFVVTQQAFVSDLQPVTGDSAVGFDPTVGVVSEGVTLLVEGVVSSDRRYVTMNIDAGVARIDGFAQQAVTAVAGGQLVNSASTQSFLQLPTITVTRVRTTATVPDEGTLLIGGQRLITEVEVETGVPVLSKIPIINRFFTNRLESKEEQTLLILLKPTILIQSEEEEKAFPGLLDSVRTGGGLTR